MSVLQRSRQDLLEIYHYAIESVKPHKLIKKNVTFQEDSLTVRSLNTNPIKISDLKNCRIHVIGGGKSVLGMARGLALQAKLAGIQKLFSHGFLSIPLGLKSDFDQDSELKGLLSSISTRCSFGSKHNLPDENSVTACIQMREEIKEACMNDKLDNRKPLFIVLVSGGGSSCLTSPRLIDLDTKLMLIKHLVQKGADIVELNKVRRYFSNIKGGRLATEIMSTNPRSRIVSLILSDVIGDSVDFIASGPTSVSTSEEQQVESMLEVLNKYGYNNSDISIEFKKNASKQFKKEQVSNCVIGSNLLALEAARDRATLLGYNVQLFSNSLRGDTTEVVNQVVEYADSSIQQSAHLLVLAGGEATVTRLEGQSWGRGGRLQEMAVDYLIKKLETQVNQPNSTFEVDMFFAGSTDGQDGPTEVAACCTSVTEILLSSMELSALLKSAKESKVNHDTFHFWTENLPTTLISSSMTGTNVMDLFFHLLKRGNTSKL